MLTYRPDYYFSPDCPADHRQAFVNAARYIADREKRIIEHLRARGVKAAHPDDGWVNREKNFVAPVYCRFDDGVAEGDLVALTMYEKMRIVRIVRIDQRSRSRPTWHFEPVEEYSFQ